MNIPEEYRFIIQLGKALHRYGVPSYRIQEFLTEVADAQGIRGDFMDLPTWVNYVFYEDEEQQTYNYVRNIDTGGYNMGDLAYSVDITTQFINKELTVSQARQALKDLSLAPPLYNTFTRILTYGISSASFVVMLHSNVLSVIVALFVGIIVGVCAHFSQQSSYLNSALESIAAFIATILTGVCYYFCPEINLTLNIIAAIIIFVPGLAITTAIEEITSKSLVSGTAKLFDAVLSLFKQFLGVMLGLTLLMNVIELPTMVQSTSLPSWTSWVAIPIFMWSLMPVFNVRRRDVPGCIITGFTSFALMISLESDALMMSTFLGAIVVVLLSKGLSRLTKSPKLVFSTMGIIMLVPGSRAFLGLSSAFDITSTPLSASHVAGQVVVILMGIIGGLIFSGVFKRTRS